MNVKPRIDNSIGLSKIDAVINDMIEYREGAFLVCTRVELVVGSQMNEAINMFMWQSLDEEYP